MAELNKRAVEKVAEISGLKVSTVVDLLSHDYIFVHSLKGEWFWTKEELWES